MSFGALYTDHRAIVAVAAIYLDHQQVTRLRSKGREQDLHHRAFTGSAAATDKERYRRVPGA